MPTRKPLSVERPAVIHKFSIAQHEGYIIVGLYDNSQPGELFIIMSKEGSTISGLTDTIGITVSMALQYGVPLSSLCDKFRHASYEPSGWTTNPSIGFASSITDYVFRWLEHKFVKAEEVPAPVLPPEPHMQEVKVDPAALARLQKQIDKTRLAHSTVTGVIEAKLKEEAKQATLPTAVADGPPCVDCGCLMVRSGACYKCLNCGGTSGCS